MNRRRPHLGVGGWFDDVVDWSEGAAEDATNAVVDVVTSVPGVDEGVSSVEDAASFLGSLPGFEQAGGLLQDFARTPYGRVALTALSTNLTGGLAPIVGPQLATVAFSLPGVLRGEKFDEAWVNEFAMRVQRTAAILGADFIDEVFMPQFTAAMQELAANFNLGDLATWTTQQLADRLHIREDVAAYALSLWNRTGPPNKDAYDPETGKYLVFVDHLGWLTSLTSEQMRVPTSNLQNEISSSTMNFAETYGLPTSHPAPAQTRVTATRPAEPAQTNWLAWIGGGVVAIGIGVVGYLKFFRR